jgi:hypothetical protein
MFFAFRDRNLLPFGEIPGDSYSLLIGIFNFFSMLCANLELYLWPMASCDFFELLISFEACDQLGIPGLVFVSGFLVLLFEAAIFGPERFEGNRFFSLTIRELASRPIRDKSNAFSDLTRSGLRAFSFRAELFFFVLVEFFDLVDKTSSLGLLLGRDPPSRHLRPSPESALSEPTPKSTVLLFLSVCKVSSNFSPSSDFIDKSASPACFPLLL